MNTLGLTALGIYQNKDFTTDDVFTIKASPTSVMLLLPLAGEFIRGRFSVKNKANIDKIFPGSTTSLEKKILPPPHQAQNTSSISNLPMCQHTLRFAEIWNIPHHYVNP